MATMYVTEQGARIEKEYRRFLVSKEDKVLMAVPAARLSHVVLVGRVGATTPALHALLREGVGLSLVSRSGQLLGRLSPPTGKNIPPQVPQAEIERIDRAVGQAAEAADLAALRGIEGLGSKAYFAVWRQALAEGETTAFSTPTSMAARRWPWT